MTVTSFLGLCESVCLVLWTLPTPWARKRGTAGLALAGAEFQCVQGHARVWKPQRKTLCENKVGNGLQPQNQEPCDFFSHTPGTPLTSGEGRGYRRVCCVLSLQDIQCQVGADNPEG